MADKPIKIDINDPTAVLPDDEIELDPQGDAFAGPPPVPDGVHKAKLLLGPQGVSVGKTDQGTAYIMVQIEARVLAEGESFDNFPVFDTASTLVQESTGTSRVSGVLGALGIAVPARIRLSDLARMLTDALEGSPLVTIKTQWEGYCGTCPGKKPGKIGRVVLRGQKRFPEGKHVTECPNCGSEVVAQARIRSYSAA